MQSAEIARRFLAYFEAQGHTIVPSANLVADDPTLLFVVAGMQPFKPYLLGQQTPPFKRAADVQKCVRTLDIEEVGKTTTARHVLPDARQLVVRRLLQGRRDPVRLGADHPVRRRTAASASPRTGCGRPCCTATTRPTRSGGTRSACPRAGSSAAAWPTTTGTWACAGPGGPCSEIYYDRGPEYGREGGPEVDEDRYLEFWNLVFMQDQLSEVRKKDDFDIEGPLPMKNVDTGMGLERMAALLQGVDNIYEIDTTYKILERGGRAHRAGLRHRPAQRRRAAGRRRPRAQRGDADRGRGAARATRAAATCSGGCCGAASATCACCPAPSAAAARRPAAGFMHELTDDHHRRDGRAVPRAAPRRGATSTGSSTPRTRPSPTRSAPAPRSSTWRSRRPSASTPAC